MRLNKTLLGALSAAGLALGLASAPANALVCGPFSADPALSCQGTSDASDSAADIDALYPRAPENWQSIDKDVEFPDEQSSPLSDEYFFT